MTSLTPSVRLPTRAAFPEYTKDDATKALELRPSDKHKIIIQACSEFMNFDIPGSKYGASSNFIMLHDSGGQPMILSIGTNKKLYLCAYVNGGSGSWQTFDVTPAGGSFEAQVCDASQSPTDKKLLIAVSGRDPQDKSKTKVYHAFLECPKLLADDNGKVQTSPFSNMLWTEIGGKISARDIKTLVCESFGGSAQYRIVAGVAATKCEGSHYIFSPATNDWEIVIFPQQVETIRSVVPANLPALGPGHIVLFEDNSVQKTVSCFFQGDGASKQVFLKGLKNPTKLSTTTNRKGLSDILVAAENGVGFIDNMKMTEAPQLLLQDITCSNVVGSECIVSKEESTLFVHALSTQGELFVIEAQRKVAEKNAARFPDRLPLPIRTGLQNISGHANPLTGGFEMVYVKRDSDELVLFSRDQMTSMWKQTDMIVASKTRNEKVTTPSFLTTVVLKNEVGVPVPPGYTVNLSSSPCQVYINDRSYNLTHRPQAVPVNQFGQLQIIVPTADSLAAAPIAIHFQPDSGETDVFQIQPAQRVLHSLGNIKTGEDLKNARTSDNRPWFSSAMKAEHGDKFDEVAQLLSKIPVMVQSADGKDAPSTVPQAEEITLAWQKDESGTKKSSSSGWISDAVDAVGDAIGDIVEFLKTAVKTVVKVVLKITGPLIRLILKIGGKVIRFVLKTVGTILSGVAYALEAVFGIDVRDWFLFRYMKVEATQKELASIVDCTLGLTSRYLHQNHATLDSTIDSFGRLLEAVIARPPGSVANPTVEDSGSSLLDNPIISNLLKFNPLSWIMEAISEEFGDLIKIPSLDLGIGIQLFSALNDQFGLLLGFLKRSWAGFANSITEPEHIQEHLFNILRDGFWTIFDSIKKLIMSIFSFLMNSFDKIIDFCRGTWEIPLITDLWVGLTGIDFTLINFVSYVGAQILELFNPGSKPLLEGLGMSSLLNDLKDKTLPSLISGKRQQDLQAYLGESNTTFEDMKTMVASEQEKGTAYMAANPVATPRFGLMNTTISEGKPGPVRPSDAVLYTLGFARSGKAMSRVGNVALQGFTYGGSSSDTTSLGKGGKGFEEGADDLGDSFELARKSTAGSLSEAMEAAPSTSGKPPAIGSLKAVAIGNCVMGFGCRVLEQVLLYNYFDEGGRSAENFDANNWEMGACLAGLVLSCFADNAAVLAVSNLLMSGGSLASSIAAPSKGALRYSEMVGSGASSLSSVLFLVKEPTCQGVAWGGTVADLANSLVLFGGVFTWVKGWCRKEEKPDTEGTETIPDETGGEKIPEEKPKTKDDVEEGNKRRRIVDAQSAIDAKDLSDTASQLQKKYMLQCNLVGDPIMDIFGHVLSLGQIHHGMEWTLGNGAVDSEHAYFLDRLDGVGPHSQGRGITIGCWELQATLCIPQSDPTRQRLNTSENDFVNKRETVYKPGFFVLLARLSALKANIKIRFEYGPN